MEFRNINVDRDAPIEEVGFTAILWMVERGGIVEWRRILKVVRADPYGKVAEELEAALEVAAEYAPSTVVLLGDALKDARDKKNVETAADS
ncbi:MAG: hypothetical protein WED09_05355 [Homoserinimonas sp.]